MTLPSMKPSQQNPNRWSRLREWIRKHFDIVVELNILKILKVRPKTPIGQFIFYLVVVSILLGCVYLFVHKYQKEPQHDPTIAVFFPDPSRLSEGAFYQDGVVQKKGFDKAIQDAEELPNKLNVEFQFMKRDDTPDTLLNAMKNLYETKGTTFFIMTMSGKILGVRDHFKNWHNECVHQGKREPILIATVASAPDIADASSGILRWYVRSEEESSLLAEYLRWKEAVDRAAVFFITRTAGLSDDAYGRRGMEVFRDRFSFSLGGLPIDMFSVTATTARTEIEKFIAKYRNNAGQNKDRTGVFIVGYGDMVKETLSELITQGFGGPIACTSTLTEPDWQPKDTNADHRIFTVLPRMADPKTKLGGDDRNVVFFFAKEALYRVLELTAKDANPRTFVDRWKRSETRCRLDQEYLSNGDIIVQLEVVGAECWR